MSREATLQFLGTGASSGVPVIGCQCHVCRSHDPKNQRTRSASLIRFGEKNYLIDAGPDIRRQALEQHIERVDGLILTHTHFDHVGGLEELRVYNFLQKAPIPCILSSSSLHEVRSLYHYHFKEKGNGANYSAQFDFKELRHPSGTAVLDTLSFSYTSYMQGEMPVLGLRIGTLAYLTDIKTYDEAALFSFLKGVKTLVVSALKFTPSPIHFTIDEAVDFAERTGAEKSYFIHLSHEVDYESASTLLPQGIYLAYDGLTINFEI